jgi:hypothetical protein
MRTDRQRDRQMDRHYGANSPFSQFCERTGTWVMSFRELTAACLVYRSRRTNPVGKTQILTVSIIHIMNKHDALFIFSLLSYHRSTCFWPIFSPLSGDRMCSLNVANGTSFTFKSSVSGPGLARWQWVKQVPFATYIHSTTWCWLKMGPKHVDVW